MTTPLNFASDNAVAVHPQVWKTLQEIDQGAALPYGQDAVTRKMEEQLQKVFATECAAYTITNGTSCNSLIFSTLVHPDEAILCHNLSHIYNNECNAPEFFTHGARLVPLAHGRAKCRVEDVETFLQRGWDSVHNARPACLSITQISEVGCRYTPEELRALSHVCRKNKMFFHVDGARFANAVAAGNESPAALSHECGIDALSLGFTKNGAFAAEAAVFFNREHAQRFERLRKRGGQLWSKMRYISGQILALLENDTWITLARHSNTRAQELAEVFHKKGIKPLFPVDGNHVFVRLSDEQAKILEQNNVLFYHWNKLEGACRFVTAWNTSRETLDALERISF